MPVPLVRPVAASPSPCIWSLGAPDVFTSRNESSPSTRPCQGSPGDLGKVVIRCPYGRGRVARKNARVRAPTDTESFREPQRAFHHVEVPAAGAAQPWPRIAGSVGVLVA